MNAVIETDRLVLCTFKADDVDLIYELNRDPEVTRYSCDPVFDLEQAKKFLNEIILPQYALYNYGRWATFLKLGLEFIGWCA
jgi:RimJ/RimL family protein N-acetyltransferase